MPLISCMLAASALAAGAAVYSGCGKGLLTDKDVLAMTGLFVASNYDSMIYAETGLVTYWRFEEEGGVSYGSNVPGGYGCVLMPSGDVVLSGGAVAKTLETNRAITINVGGSVGCAYTNSFSTSPFSVEFWVKKSGACAGSTMFYFFSGPTAFYAGCDGANNNYLFFDLDDGADEAFLDAPRTMNDGLWHHIVTVRNEWDSSIFLDGVNIGNAVASPAIPSLSPATISIGNDTFSIDEFAIYNTALSSERVSTHYRVGKGWQ